MLAIIRDMISKCKYLVLSTFMLKKLTKELSIFLSSVSSRSDATDDTDLSDKCLDLEL